MQYSLASMLLYLRTAAPAARKTDPCCFSQAYIVLIKHSEQMHISRGEWSSVSHSIQRLRTTS